MQYFIRQLPAPTAQCITAPKQREINNNKYSFVQNKKMLNLEPFFTRQGLRVSVCVCVRQGRGNSIGIFHDILFGPEKGRFIIAQDVSHTVHCYNQLIALYRKHVSKISKRIWPCGLSYISTLKFKKMGFMKAGSTSRTLVACQVSPACS